MVNPLISCELSEVNAFSSVRNDLETSQLRGQLSNFEIVYEDVPETAKAAIEKAVSIWEQVVVSAVPIMIKVSWTSLNGTTLAQSGATKVHRNFRNAIYKDVWYPTPLAESIAGADLNNGETDMVVNINKDINWSYATDGRATVNKYDMVTVVLHEIAHGLGINASFDVSTNTTTNEIQGKWGQSGYAYIYDVFIIDAFNRQLIDTKVYGNPSDKLNKILTGNVLYFDLRTVSSTLSLPKVYAPSPFKSGGNVSHLDEQSFPIGNENSLMSPTIRAAEVVHQPGSVILAILYKLGWAVATNVVDTEIVTSVEPATTPEVLIFPNPVTEQLQIAIPLASPRRVSIKLMNLNGSTIIENQWENVSSESFLINCTNFQEGVYFVRVNDGNRVTSKKIVVRK